VTQVLSPVVQAIAPVVAPVTQVVAPVAQAPAPVVAPAAPAAQLTTQPASSPLASVARAAPMTTPPTQVSEAQASAPSGVVQSFDEFPAAAGTTNLAPATTAPTAVRAPAAPAWTSPLLTGPDSASTLQQLGAVPPAVLVAAGQPSATRGGGTAPSTPFDPPCNAGSSPAAAAGGLGSGGLAAIAAAALTCRPSPALHPHRLSSALWRPTAFVSLQERPG
jgi:hypothetical protein